MGQLSLANVVNISVAQPGAGIGLYNTSNVALFTRETAAASFGTLGYQLYLSATQVGIDFGTSSNTYAMALAVFAQQPNILANGGYLVVIPMLSSAQTAVDSVSFANAPASGAFTFTYNSIASSSIAWNATASTIQTALRTITGLGSVTVAGSIAAGLTITFAGVSGALLTPLTVTSNTLLDSTSAAVVPTVSVVTIGSSAETLDSAILRTQGLVQYFGIMSAQIETQIVGLQAALTVQSLNKILFLVSYTGSDIAPGGYLDLIRTGSFTQTRGLFYGDVLATALVFMAAYVGRALSTNFNGSNTTQDMHLKSLVGPQPDPSMSQSVLNLAQAAGADTYPSIQGVPKVFCSGANMYFDRVYNAQWFVGALQVAAFNLLAQTTSKITQTENGVAMIKSALTQVCEQAVTNAYAAPGTWTSPTTFGSQADLLANVSQRGYYIYSQPVSLQSTAARAARQAPVVQIALKEAGSIESSSVIINVNA